MIKHVSLPQPHKNLAERQSGFTLLELTMVLFIMTLILGGLLSPLSSRLEQEGRKKSQGMLEDIRSSVLGYTAINGHFPCPDCRNGTISPGCVTVNSANPAQIGDGIEDGIDSSSGVAVRGAFATCATETGFLPWVTLGVPENDAWGQRFVYSVDEKFADDVDGVTGADCTATTATTNVSFCLTSVDDGDMTINNIAGAVVAQNIPALVFSLGANGNTTQERINDGDISAAELENWWTDAADRTFISDNYVETTGSQYDDLLIWIAAPTLMYRMINAEQLP